MSESWRPSAHTPVSSAGPLTAEQRAAFSRVDPASRAVVLFDWDGTLCDTRAGIVATARVALTRWGMSEDALGDVGRLTGPTFPYAFSEVYGVTPAEAREISDIYHELYDALGPEARPLFPGVPQLLAELKRAGKVLALASSKREHKLTAMVEEAGIGSYFDAVVGAVHPDRVNKTQVISLALEQLEADARDALMVGDRFYDVEGAAAAGLPCVGANFGTARPGELAEAGACAVVDDVAGLGRALLGQDSTGSKP